MDKSTAYVSTNLILPYSSFNVDFCEVSLTMYIGRKKLKFLNRGKTHFTVPRYYLSAQELSELDCPVVYLPPPKFEKVTFNRNIELRENQEPIWEAFKKAESGFLTLAPGKGKTVLSLLKIAHTKTPALISVNTTSLVEQWKGFIEKFLGVKDVGVIGDGKMDWQKPGLKLLCILLINHR